MNYKKIGLLVAVISVLLNAYFLKDYVFKKKDDALKVKFECRFKDNPNLKDGHIGIYHIKGNKVYQTYQSEDGEYARIYELENCVIVDNQNWSCGGNTTLLGVAATHVLNNGKFSYSNGYFNNLSNNYVCKPKQLD
jgi:hypothetical protein